MTNTGKYTEKFKDLEDNPIFKILTNYIQEERKFKQTKLTNIGFKIIDKYQTTLDQFGFSKDNL